MKIHQLLAALVLGTAVAACSAVNAAPSMHMMSKPTTVRLKALNGSGQSGIATLWNVTGGVQVQIALQGEPQGAVEPAHIHTGSCSKLDPKPFISLTNVVNGRSITTISKMSVPGGATVAMLTRGSYAINVHRSLKNLKLYVSCGDLLGAR